MQATGNNMGKNNKFRFGHWHVGEGRPILRQTKLNRGALASNLDMGQGTGFIFPP